MILLHLLLLIAGFLHAEEVIADLEITPHAPVCEVVCPDPADDESPDAPIGCTKGPLAPVVSSAHGRVPCQHTSYDDHPGGLTAHGLCCIGTIWHPDLVGRLEHVGLGHVVTWPRAYREAREFEELARCYGGTAEPVDSPGPVDTALSRISGLLRLRSLSEWRQHDCSELLRCLKQCSESRHLAVRWPACSGLIRLDHPPSHRVLLELLAGPDDTEPAIRYGTTVVSRGALRERILNDIRSRLSRIFHDLDDRYGGTRDTARRQAALEPAARWKDFDLISFLNGLDGPTKALAVVAEIVDRQLDENGVPAVIGRTYRKGSSLLLVPLLSNADRGPRRSAAVAIDRMTGHLQKFPYASRPDDAVDRYVAAVRDWVEQHPDWARHCERRLLSESQMVSEVDARYPHVEPTLVQTYLAKIRGHDRPHGSELPGQLADMGEGAMPILIRCLHDDNKRVRYCAMMTLSKMGDGAASFLVYLLRSQDRGLRSYSVQRMRRLEDPPAAVLDALTSSLEYDPEPSVRKWAARALWVISPDPASARPLLRKALEDPDPGVRKEALNGLEQIGDAQ